MVAQLVLLFLGLVFMGAVVRVLAPGFTARPDQFALAVSLSRIAFPYLIFTVVAVQLSAMLNANHLFGAAAAWSIFLNLAMIGTLLAASWFPSAAYAAAWGVFLGGILQTLFIVFAAARSGLHLHLHWPRWTPAMKEFLLALGAATVGSASVQIGLFVDTLLASFLPSGDLTALYYADRINQLPMGTLGVALGTVLLPDMAARLARGDLKGAHASQNRGAALGLLLTLPFVAAYFAVPGIIMRGLLAHGAFHLDAAALSAQALMAYGVGLPAFVLVRVLAPAFYARGDTKTPVRATMISVAVNIAVKFALVWVLHWGVVGLALGTSIAAWVNVAVLAVLASRRNLLAVDKVFSRAIGPILLAAVATGLCARLGAGLAQPLIQGSMALRDSVALAAAIAAGGVGYGLVLLLFRRSLPLGRLAR